MTAAVRRDARLLIADSVAVVVLAAGSTVALAAATGQFDTRRPVQPTLCGAASTLPGAVIDVSLSGMPSMMRSGQPGWRTSYTGMMRALATPASAPHGTVSLRVTNLGVIRHELLVLPLHATALQAGAPPAMTAPSTRPAAAARPLGTVPPAAGTASPRVPPAGSHSACRPDGTSCCASCPATTRPECSPNLTSPSRRNRASRTTRDHDGLSSLVRR